MSKPNYDSTFGFRSNWTNGAARRLRENYQQTELPDAQDCRNTVTNQSKAHSDQDKRNDERPVKKKHVGCPLEPFKITLALIEQMTNEAAE